MRHRKDGLETKRQVLAAAAEVFGQKGYRDATIAEICRRAGANTASVNYHFGDKETLYAEAWRQAFQESTRKYPPDGGVPVAASPEERFRGRVLALLLRILDPASCEFDIVHKEMANPTGLLAEVMQKSIEPIREGFCALLRELLGDGATEEDVLLCHMSVRSQCFSPLIRAQRPGARAVSPARVSHPRLGLGAEDLADHITRFSLAGIRTMRRRQTENARPARTRVARARSKRS